MTGMMLKSIGKTINKSRNFFFKKFMYIYIAKIIQMMYNV